MDDFNPNSPPGEEPQEATPQVKPFNPNEPPPEPASVVEQKLALAHKHYLEHGDEYFGRTSPGYLEERIPAVNIGSAIGHYINLSGAIKGMKSGTPSDDDINTLAQFKARQDYEAQKSGAGNVVDMATKVPALAAEFAMSGGAGTAAKEAAAAGVGKYMAEGLATKAAGYAANLGVRTALTPSMYMDHAVNANIDKDRDPLDPRGLPGAMGLALAQNAVLGEVGRLTGKAFVGEGVKQAAGRVAVQAASGPFAQAATDAATGLMGLSTGYGTGEMILKGKYGDALQHATMDALTFGAFGLAHEIAGGAKHEETTKAVAEKIKTTLDAQAKAGATPDQAAAVLTKEVQELKAAVVKAPPEPPKAPFNPQEPPVQPAPKVEPPKAYAHVDDEGLIATATAFGMKVKKGPTRADAEKYLKENGVREEMLEATPAKPQVIQPQAPEEIRTNPHQSAPAEQASIKLSSGATLQPSEEEGYYHIVKDGKVVGAVLANTPEQGAQRWEEGEPRRQEEAAALAEFDRKSQTPSPVGKSFTEAFPDAKPTPRPGEWKAEMGGRTIYAVHNPETNNVRIDFGWTDKAPEGSPTSGPKANIPKTLQPESKDMLRKLKGFVENLKDQGVGIEYTAHDGRADAYRRIMEKAGFEQATGPTKHSEATSLYSWKPKEEAKPSLLERFKNKGKQDVATPEQATQEPRKLRDIKNYQPPSDYEKFGLSKVESYAYDAIQSGMEVKDIVAQNDEGLNSKQAVHQAALRASTKLGNLDPETGKPKSAIRMLAERSVERSGFNSDGSPRPVEITDEAIKNYQDELAQQGTYMTDTEARKSLQKAAVDVHTKEDAFSNVWKEYFEKVKETDAYKNGSDDERRRIWDDAARAFKDGEDPPSALGPKAQRRAQRKALKQASIRPDDTSGLREGAASGSEAQAPQAEGNQAVGGSASASQPEAAGNKLGETREEQQAVQDIKRAGHPESEAPGLLEQARRIAQNEVASEPGNQPDAEQRSAGPIANGPDAQLESPGGEPGGGDFGRPVTAEERSVLPGGGQANAENAQRPKKFTALANEKIDQERAAAGKPPMMEAARQSNPESWDKAMDVLEKDPEAGAKLVKDLLDKPRSANVVENALLLHRKIALSNEIERAAIDHHVAMRGGDAIDMAEAEGRYDKYSGALDDLEKAARLSGTEWGREGQFRRQLAAEDFSLGNMLMTAQAAKGRPLTPEERKKVIDQSAKIKELQERLAKAEDDLRKAVEAGGGKVGSKAFGEWTKARGETKKATGKWQDSLKGDKDARRSFFPRMEDWLVKVRRAFVISSPTTMLKIVAASAERLGIAPLEEAVGGALGRIPGLAKIAQAAPREGGFSTATEKKAFASSWMQGMIDAWQTAKAGKSELDVLYGKNEGPRSLWDLPGELHAAGKAPAVRAEYTRSFLKRVDQAIATGQDSTSPAALIRIGTEAYKDSQRAKFQQDNRAVQAWQKGIDWLTAKDASAGSKALGLAGKLALPVVKIPTNLVAETLQYATGSITGSVRMGLALKNGVENLKPAEADVIMRSLKKGSLGLAVLALGYANPQMLGGFYSGKRDEGDVEAGGIKTPVGTVPSWALHNPLLEVLQMGATIRRASDKLYKGNQQGTAEGVVAGMAGLAEEVPFMREAKDLGSMVSTNPRERGYAFGQFAKSLAIPQLVQWIAGQTDRNAQGPVKRKPETVTQQIKTGIPGLRQTVPAK